MAREAVRMRRLEVPTAREAALARETSRRLAAYLDMDETLTVQITGDEESGENLSLPAPAVRLLLDILTEMAAGNAVTLIPVRAELTTQQAADVLNVSRPYLVGLLEQEKIPHHKVGTHRRVLFEDLTRYKKSVDGKRRRVLDDMVGEAEDLDLGY